MNPEEADYPQLGGFEHVHLEDSFVLGIEATPARLTLDVELVLTPQHPAYRSPAPGEQNCYARATIEFRNVRNLNWTGQGTPPATDVSGEKDYGGIDALSRSGAVFHLEGDWGAIDMTSDAPEIRFGPDGFTRNRAG
ncbi:hypothetical protein [Streptomyces fulvoviolaceus]|uniref:hypothetical protein n=1 Tax=Streptomyces fulvoviolaceus TaxID=285535 RepID=UPI0021C13637|nr:hypothetical protein [Streptomyces fulvoviolaceus]MCT9081144.1 hypothetical protein [Streptomyces fulvoviolaceus]